VHIKTQAIRLFLSTMDQTTAHKTRPAIGKKPQVHKKVFFNSFRQRQSHRIDAQRTVITITANQKSSKPVNQESSNPKSFLEV
jgi:hypothetical protein